MKTLKKIIKLAMVVIVLAAITAWYFLIGPHGSLEGRDFNLKSNGLWLRHAWVGNEQETIVIEDLALKLAKYDIRYVYVHTGPFDSDGTIPEERYKFANDFLKILKAENPDVIALAWVGQVRSELDIDNPSIRENITTTCEKLISQTGFDGIHYDIEPIAHDDMAFLTLLQETRIELGEDVLISVATDEWQPSLLSDLAGEIMDKDIKSYWETEYFEATAEIADQIVVMTYDTSLGEIDHYEWLIEQQIIYLTQILDGYSAELLIGIPTYDDDKESFDPLVENMETGLNGVIQGLNNKRAEISVFTGVAIYADWETDESEWKIYEQLWQGW